MNAVTHHAKVIVSTVLKLYTEDQHLAQVYAEAGLPPISPLVSHTMLVETRNHVFGALFPGPRNPCYMALWTAIQSTKVMLLVIHKDKEDNEVEDSKPVRQARRAPPTV